MTVLATVSYSVRQWFLYTVYGTSSVTHWYAGCGAGMTHGLRLQVWQAEAVCAVSANVSTAATHPMNRTRIVSDLPWVSISPPFRSLPGALVSSGSTTGFYNMGKIRKMEKI